MLSQPEFKDLQWSSLQPNIFATQVMAPALELIKEHKKTGLQGPLSMIMDTNSPNGVIDAYDVGVFAAHLLASDQTDKHNKARYVLTGPENVTGEQIIKLVEQYIGEPVTNVKYKDFEVIDQWAETMPEHGTLFRAIKRSGATIWGGSAVETQSKEVSDIYAPKRTVAEVLKEMVERI
jgi:uncharacterized protein YbjT (DUF2867 family)